MESVDMGTEGGLADLEALDPLTVARAVRAWAEKLRTVGCDPSELMGVVSRLAELARDPRASVRQAVAEASPYLPERAYKDLAPLLAEDKNPYVRDAAERAARRWSTLRRAAAQGEEHDARVDRWYREIDRTRSGGRAIARRIAAHETEYFVRRMCHEAESTFLGFSAAMRGLRAALDAPEIHRTQVRAYADRLDERFAFFQHVLETGRRHAQNVEPDFRNEALAPILTDEAELLRSRFPDRADRILADLSGVDRKITLDTDASFLRQAFANILKNAVEAYDGRAAVTIRIRITARLVEGGADVAITFADEGGGMSEESVARGFVPFGSSKKGGTGFGLFIARRVARGVHGGDLTLSSTLGEGTSVTMVLPVRQERKARKR